MTNKQSRKTFRSRLEDMVTILRDEIITGKRPVGDYLPNEKDLGEQFQLSNKSVRKGLDTLVSEGLIVKIPRVGNMVASPAEEGTVVIKFGYHATIAKEAEIEQLLSEFHKSHPYIRVQAYSMPHMNYQGRIAEYKMLDVTTLNYNDFQEFIDNDSASLLEPQEQKPEVYPFLTKAFTHEEQLLIQPFIFSPLVLCYNKDHFAEKNLMEPDSSWNWDDVARNAEKLTVEKDRYGFYFHLLSRNRWPVFLLQSGSKIQRGEQGAKICGTKWMEALNVCRDLIFRQNIVPSLLSESDADAEELFLRGKVSMIMATYFSLNILKKAPFPFDISPLPYLHEPKTLLMVIGLAINRESKVKEAAKTLIDFLTSFDSQLKIRQNTFSIPAIKAAAEWMGEETMYRPSRFHMYKEIIPTFRLYTDLNLKAYEFGLILREAKLLWSGLENEETICRRLEQVLQRDVQDKI